MHLRNHTHICTGCERSFPSYKQLRKHWDGDCPLSQTIPPAPKSPEPSLIESPLSETPLAYDWSAHRPNIDPALNLWLNEDELDDCINHNGVEYDENENDNQEDDGGYDTKTFDIPTSVDALEQIMNAKRDELLMTLLDVVEKLSVKVFGDDQKVHAQSVGPSHDATSHNSVTSQDTFHYKNTTNEWITVPGMPKKSSNSTAHKQIEISNKFEALRTKPEAVNQEQPPYVYQVQSKPITRTQKPDVVKRPQVVINNRPESVKVVPGHSSFSDTVKEGHKVALFSDSICNRMNKYELKKKLKCNINKKSFPGATTIDMYEHYMMPTLKRDTPDTAIIHIGVNDILAKGTTDGGLTANAIQEIAKDVIKCGEVCQSAGVNNICISSILPFKGRRAELTINNINHQLAKLCLEKSYDFILNDNIIFDNDNILFYGDGLHLNEAGRNILMENFSSYLRMD